MMKQMSEEIPQIIKDWKHEEKNKWKATAYLQAIMLCRNSFEAWNFVTFYRDDIIQCFGEYMRSFLKEDEKIHPIEIRITKETKLAEIKFHFHKACQEIESEMNCSGLADSYNGDPEEGFYEYFAYKVFFKFLENYYLELLADIYKNEENKDY